MASATKYVRFSSGEAAPEGQAVAEVQAVDADGNPVDVGGSPSSGSVGTVQLADGAVTAAKLAPGVLPVAATTAKAGLVKRATIAEGADAAAIREALIAAGIAQ